jgi:hypothetical protein
MADASEFGAREDYRQGGKDHVRVDEPFCQRGVAAVENGMSQYFLRQMPVALALSSEARRHSR